jgi:hypothetical protein
MINLNQDDLLIKVNRIMRKDYTHKSLLQTIEDLVKKVEQQEWEYITLSQSIEEDDAVIGQLQDEVKLLKLHESLLLERVKKAESKSRFHKYMELEQENLALAQEIACCKEKLKEIQI